MLTLDRKLMQLGAALLLAHAMAVPAQAGPLYSYQSEEGTLSFTDSLKKVPQRYLSQVETRQLQPLREYPRFTAESSQGSYPDRLAARLAELRKREFQREEQARLETRPVGTTLALRTGGEESPTLELGTPAGGEPVVVETLFTRPEGKMVTRQSVVVRHGDETLAIVRPRLREWNVNEDIHGEAAVER